MLFHQKTTRTDRTNLTRSKTSTGEYSGARNPLAKLQQGLGNRGMSQLISQSVQRKAAEGSVVQRMSEDEEELQLKRDPSKAIQRQAESSELEEEELQMKRDPSKPIQRKSNSMPEVVQEKMESAFKADFSNVKIHEGNKAESVGALAYTQGDEIHFAQGKYKPDTQSGQELLGHELAHVVQQRQGRVQPTGDVNGVPLNDEPALEKEADRLGAKASRGT